MKFWPAVFVILLLSVSAARSFTMEEATGEKTMTAQDLSNYIKDYVDVPEGGVDWKVFGTTKEIEINSKTEEGFDLVYTKPEFQPEVKALDGKKIIIKGYMFPLDSTEEQKLFLFGPFPLTCPYQYHVGPALVLEVHADNHPVKFDYEPITVEGTLELVPEDKDYNVFYRLNDAQVK